MDWFQIGKGVHQGCILSPCSFNLYVEYIMWNDGLDEAQAGIKIAGRNINNLRYADDTTLMAESEEELKSFLMRVKRESEKVGLKLNIQKTKIMASSLITSWQIDGRQWKKWQTLFCFGAPKPAFFYGFPDGSEDKAFAWNAGDPGLIPGLGRSPGEGNGNPLQYSCLGNPIDTGAWRLPSMWSHSQT